MESSENVEEKENISRIFRYIIANDLSKRRN